MKCWSRILVAVALAAGSIASAHAAQLQRSNGKTPMQEVVDLLVEMKARIESDGKMEQMSYDKYACWVEQTLARKARDIEKAKSLIEDLEAEIVKLKAEIASHGAEIKQLDKDIAANLESQREATAARNSENGEYEGDKTESEQCTGALEAAVKVLTGAGAGKKGRFLETMKEAQLLSMAASIRNVLAKPQAVRDISEKNLQIMQQFVEKPVDFVGAHATGGIVMSAAQVGNNPFGDYAPQSTQIQGILKGMYDTFVSDMEKSNVEEAEAQKAFEALMKTKAQELATLQKTQEQHKLDEAQKSKKLADDMELLDDTKVQLEADERFFEETKKNGQVKAMEWSERSRLRTEELQGVNMAVKLLRSQDAMDTFRRSTTTLVQLKSVKHKAKGDKAGGIYGRLRGLASRFHNLALAELAVNAKSGGHFDVVMQSIDGMIAALRREEQEDIEHRDRCQRAEGKNDNDMQDLSNQLGKAEKVKGRLENEKGRLNGKVTALEGEIISTKGDMKQALDMRNSEHAEFKQAVKDDTDTINILQQAMAALTRFYEKNRIPMSLLAKSSKAKTKISETPEYTIDEDEAPETTWEGGAYGGRGDETHGIVEIVKMLIEDVQKELETLQADEAKAQQAYEKERVSMQESLDAQTASKIATERYLGDTKENIQDTEQYMAGKSADLAAEQKLDKAIYADCSWVETHFDSRREKRKVEIAGLQEAKSYLSGAESGEDVI